MDELYALVLAGGRGSRFWPLSRRSRPKQCVALDGQRTLLQQTVDRLHPLIPPERILVVTGPDMADLAREQLAGIPRENILIEPRGRNTAPCIGWGAVEVGRRGSDDAVMAVLPSDHAIADEAAFRTIIRDAEAAARATAALVALGVTPDRPEPGYGYLEVGAQMGNWGDHAFHLVERFTEKPDLETARRYVQDGRHLWNAGMFVFMVGAIRDAIRMHLPLTAEALGEIQRNPARLEEAWDRTDATSIDYGVMERSRHILTVRCDFGWSDVGTWDRAAELMPTVPGGRGVARMVIAQESQGCVVHAPSKVVALVGLSNVVVADTDDALLVMQRDRAEDVRDVMQVLEELGEDEIT